MNVRACEVLGSDPEIFLLFFRASLTLRAKTTQKGAEFEFPKFRLALRARCF